MNGRRIVAFLLVSVLTLVNFSSISVLAASRPTVDILPATNVTENSATINAKILFNGGSEINEYGFLWGTNTSNMQRLVVGREHRMGQYYYTLTGLQSSTTYYYYAYAKNSVDKGDNDIFSFTTLPYNQSQYSIPNESQNQVFSDYNYKENYNGNDVLQTGTDISKAYYAQSFDINKYIRPNIHKFEVGSMSVLIKWDKVLNQSYNTVYIRKTTEQVANIVKRVEGSHEDTSFITEITGLSSSTDYILSIISQGGTHVLFSTDFTTKYFPISVIDGVEYYDFTNYIEDMLTKNLSEVRQHRIWFDSTAAAVQSLFWLKNQVDNQKRWDIKIPIRWNEQLYKLRGFEILDSDNKFKPFLYNNNIITAEDLGNIMYGYLGRAMGLSDTVIYIGGAYNAVGAFSPLLTDSDNYYGDDKQDHDMIELGIYLYNSRYSEDRSIYNPTANDFVWQLRVFKSHFE